MGVYTQRAPAEQFLQLVLGAESVESGDEEAGVGQAGARVDGGRRARTYAVDDQLSEAWWTARPRPRRRRRGATVRHQRRTCAL